MRNAKPVLRLALGAVVTALVLVTLAAPARAARVEQPDPSGDAAARFDVVRVTYTNNATAFSYRVKLRDIQRRHGTLLFPKLLIDGTWDRYFQVTSGARRDGTRFHRLTLATPDTYGQVRCPGMKATVNFATDVVTAKVPQACLVRAGFGQQRYLAIGYAATPGMQEAGDNVRRRWVAYS